MSRLPEGEIENRIVCSGGSGERDGKSTCFRVRWIWVLTLVLLHPSSMTLSKSFNPSGFCFITGRMGVISASQRTDLRIRWDYICTVSSTVPGNMLSVQWIVAVNFLSVLAIAGCDSSAVWHKSFWQSQTRRSIYWRGNGNDRGEVWQNHWRCC